MLKIIAIVVAVAIVALLGYAATKPNHFRVARSTVIKAPPEKIYALIDDFHKWGAWSPYEKLDPAMTRTYGGPASGLGSTYAWSGNGKAGAGRMEIIEAAAPSKLVTSLDFTKPFEVHNKAIFTLVPEGEATRVTWAMEGPSPFLFKVMDVIFNMDRMAGKDFETGLASLKAEAEK
ncbi:polyketide cyclase [Caulobacter sp. Root1455]|uniref:SRPBCC family protein n=1 Tax=Caulobacter sp. Root1455 TaxID=1736465 RepID=UPI0006FF7AF7|nr:SRPBCC family protein [Caulobacter sp. Root1455]KQY98895.1 polyketide cyclase [Caulobacter sp. Root1455]